MLTALFDLLDSTRWVLEVAEDMVPVLIFRSHNKRLQTDALGPAAGRRNACKDGPGPGSEL